MTPIEIVILSVDQFIGRTGVVIRSGVQGIDTMWIGRNIYTYNTMELVRICVERFYFVR